MNAQPGIITWSVKVQPFNTVAYMFNMAGIPVTGTLLQFKNENGVWLTYVVEHTYLIMDPETHIREGVPNGNSAPTFMEIGYVRVRETEDPGVLIRES